MHEIFSSLPKPLCVVSRSASPLNTLQVVRINWNGHVSVLERQLVFFQFQLALGSVAVNYCAQVVVWVGDVRQAPGVAVDSFVKVQRNEESISLQLELISLSIFLHCTTFDHKFGVWFGATSPLHHFCLRLRAFFFLWLWICGWNEVAIFIFYLRYGFL